jgi:hypothetical protein
MCGVSRVFRILINAVTACSLLACIATAAVWVRSHWYVTILDCVDVPPRGRSVATFDGALTVSQTYRPGASRGWQFFEDRWDGVRLPRRSIIVFPGVERGGKPGFWEYVSVSLAYPAALFAVPPALWAWRSVRRRPQRSRRPHA